MIRLRNPGDYAGGWQGANRRHFIISHGMAWHGMGRMARVKW